MSQALHPMLNIAIKAARAAGSIINRAALDLEVVQVGKKGPNDFVSEVDRAAEEAIIDILLDAYPDHGILAEESGSERGAKDSEYVWIIDPLDGTTNFLHGLPVYAVSIALAHRGQVQQAVVYDPTRNDMFYASRGRGAFVNDRRLRVSKRIRLADCLIGTGFPFRKGDNFKRYLKMFEEVMQSCAGLRRPGAAALDLCYVAAGWYDGFFETGLSPWDVAAGSLMITEAGGLIGNFTGEADFLHQREVVAGAPKIYGQLVTMLAPYTRVIKAPTQAEARTAKAHAAAYAAAQAAAERPAGEPTSAFVQAAQAGTAASVAGDMLLGEFDVAPAQAAEPAEPTPAAPAPAAAPRKPPLRIKRNERGDAPPSTSTPVARPAHERDRDGRDPRDGRDSRSSRPGGPARPRPPINRGR
jgi:myo-inositol-1(or 4)-monophosphatase